MQERFGDAGPGFLAAKVDKRWAFRRDIVRKTEGNWSAKNIVHGVLRLSIWFGWYSFHRSPRSKINTRLRAVIEGERQDLASFSSVLSTCPWRW